LDKRLSKYFNWPRIFVLCHMDINQISVKYHEWLNTFFYSQKLVMERVWEGWNFDLQSPVYTMCNVINLQWIDCKLHFHYHVDFLFYMQWNY
jgi:hypothetical protein